MTATALLLLPLTLLASPGTDAGAPSMADCPMHASHMTQDAQHADSVAQSGDVAMGFSHEVTAHHFYLTTSGGVISVSATKRDDITSIDAIQAHLALVARAFASGDFALPKQVHGVVPPGVSTMQERRSSIAYVFEPEPSGGRVVISSRDKKAVDAVHAFLRFQIADHRTGDPTAVRSSRGPVVP